MDFLKTMLIYMSVVFAMGMEGSATPAPDAIPTATPAPVVTAAPADATNAAAAIATPAPAGEPTAVPAPTMTPNPRYSKLSYGDRNNNVKKMQQRLIELGYMKKGSDDGVYGYGTLNAVRAFQKANGLSADGVAGKATLTCLYEDKNVVAAATATPKPTTEPEQTADGTEAVPSIMAGWNNTGASVLCNGVKLVLLDRSTSMVVQRSPAVYLHNNKPMVNLNEMCRSASWTLTEQGMDAVVLEAAGYTVTLTAATTENGETDQCTVEMDGAPVQIEAGDICYVKGEWLVGSSFLEKTMGASVIWYQEENTLVIHFTEKSASESRD